MDAKSSCSSNSTFSMLWSCATLVSRKMKPLQWMIPKSSFLKAHPAISVIFLAEGIFYLWFKFHVLPYANRPASHTPPEPFRNQIHQEQRHTVLVRLMERIRRRAKWNGQTFDETFRQFLYGWFNHIVPEQQSACNHNKDRSATNVSGSSNVSSSIDKTSSPMSGSGNESACSSEASSICGRNSLTSLSSIDQLSETEIPDEVLKETIGTAASDKKRTRSMDQEDRTPSDVIHPPLPTHDEARELMSWAFFGKHYDDIVATSIEELEELNRMFDLLERDYDVRFEKPTEASSYNLSQLKKNLEDIQQHKNTSQKDKNLSSCSSSRTLREGCMVPRKLTLEKVDPVFRPLVIYLVVFFIEWVGGVVLRYHGFRKYYSNYGPLSYWYRPGTTRNDKTNFQSTSCKHRSLLPLLFFHGLAPAGVTFYIPILLNWLYSGSKYEDSDDDKNTKKSFRTNSADTPPMFLFENKTISYGMSLYPVNEADTCASVVEALQRHLNSDVPKIENQYGGIRVCGHSFGSFQVTWMVHNPILRPLIRNVVLLEPVSVLLSDPDVLENFLYKRREQVVTSSANGIGFFDRIIYWVASTEVFTEHTIRRHFTWYNFELYLEDLPPNCRAWIGLGEKDEIVNSKKVKDEIDMTNHLIRKQQQKLNPETVSKQQTGATTVNEEKKKERLQWLPDPKANLIESKVWMGCGHAACITNKHLWKDVQVGLELSQTHFV